MTKRAGDFDKLLLGHRKRTHLGLGRNLCADALKEFRSPRAASGPIHTSERPRLFQPQTDVFRDREIGKQRGLLVNAGNAELVCARGREVRDALAVDVNAPTIRLVRAGDDLDERRVARAVLTEQRMHLARSQVKRHALERAHRPEGFCDKGELEKRGHPKILFRSAE